MVKYILSFGLIIMGLLSFPAQASQTEKNFSFKALSTNKSINLSDYQGSVILVVNTASNCGLTPQYKGLETLYQKYRNEGLVIIGVPSNDFKQEPGTDEEIAQFCQIKYDVSFPMTAKSSVKGEQAHPFYRYAKNKLGSKAAPKWNFHKYLINRKGELINHFTSTTAPNSTRLIKAIKAALDEPN